MLKASLYFYRKKTNVSDYQSSSKTQTLFQHMNICVMKCEPYHNTSNYCLDLIFLTLPYCAETGEMLKVPMDNMDN